MRISVPQRGQLLFDGEDATYQYVGEAPIGVPTSEASWRIYRLYLSGTNSVTKAWADGSDLYNKIWNNRVTYTYS